MPSTDRQETGLLPKGRISINDLGTEYAIKLDKLARKWGCETLSEAAMEVLKDAVDDELEQ
jgi:hypothetical protein